MKPCLQCHEPLPESHPDGRPKTPNEMKKSKFCDPSCAGTYNNARRKKSDRICKVCNTKAILRQQSRRNPDLPESESLWLRRKYCSTKCRNILVSSGWAKRQKELKEKAEREAKSEKIFNDFIFGRIGRVAI